jgi:hypothetical protein
MTVVVSLRTGKQVSDPRKVALRMAFRHGIEARFIALDNLQLALKCGAHCEARGWLAILAGIDELLRAPSADVDAVTQLAA